MHRRDLLLLRTASGRSIAELSCEQLYMRFADAESPHVGTADLAEDPSAGEPEALFDAKSTTQLFDDLAEALSRADTVRVTDRSWLTDRAFNERVERLLSIVRGKGILIELS